MCSWTASYAQTGDTLTCYDNTELKQIAARVVRANECDTLLDIAETQLLIKDSVITTQFTLITYKDSIISLKDNIIFKHDDIIVEKDLNIDELNTKLKWTKAGWIGTTVGLVALWLATLLG
jgi:hypothetical protein